MGDASFKLGTGIAREHPMLGAVHPLCGCTCFHSSPATLCELEVMLASIWKEYRLHHYIRAPQLDFAFSYSSHCFKRQ